MNKLLLLLLGGALGTGCRFGVSYLIIRLAGAPPRLPYATFIVNLTGSFAIGLLAQLFAVRWPAATLLRAAVLVGVLGGYTTFSSFSYETLLLIEGNRWGLAFSYALGSVLSGLLAVWVGVVVARWVGS